MKKHVVKTELKVQDRLVGILKVGNIDYICITDLAKYVNSQDPSGVIRNWMSNKNSFAFYNLWEELNNENFNSVESHRIKINEVGYNRFTMTPNRWRKEFNSIGIIPSSGKYSKGTFAHPDIAFEFASWLSPEFKLYLIREFERLKRSEAYKNKLEWDVRRSLSKTKFGMTAREWKEQNPTVDGNIRDNTDILHLVVLSNLEVINSKMINAGLKQTNRLEKLNKIAIKQLSILYNDNNITKIENMDKILLENK